MSIPSFSDDEKRLRAMGQEIMQMSLFRVGHFFGGIIQRRIAVEFLERGGDFIAVGRYYRLMHETMDLDNLFRYLGMPLSVFLTQHSSDNDCSYFLRQLHAISADCDGVLDVNTIVSHQLKLLFGSHLANAAVTLWTYERKNKRDYRSLHCLLSLEDGCFDDVYRRLNAKIASLYLEELQYYNF